MAEVWGKIEDKKQEDAQTVHFAGFEVVVENPVGTIRKWTDPFSGEKGETKMRYAYGYFKHTRGMDGDAVDVFLGPNEFSPKVFLITQTKKKDPDTFAGVDEQKIMLGFNTSVEAKAAYLAHYNNARFFRGMKEMLVEEFRDKLSGAKGKLIKGYYRNSALNSGLRFGTIQDNMMKLYLDEQMLSKSFTLDDDDEEEGTKIEKKYEGFDKLKGKLKGKVSNPGAVAASIGRKKYGKKKFQEAATSGKKMKGEETKKSLAQAVSLFTASAKLAPPPVETVTNVEPGNVELVKTVEPLAKALSAAMVSGISKRARLDAAYKAGIVMGMSHQGRFNAEPVSLDLDLGTDRVHPLHEGMPVRVRQVPTPFEIPVQKATPQDEHKGRECTAEEALPIWRR